MSNETINTSMNSKNSSILQFVGRFIVSCIILGITAYFTPGFAINNIYALALSALVLSVLDYLIVKTTRASCNSVW